MLHDRITPVNKGRDDFRLPEEKTAIADARIKHEAHPDIVALALHAIKATSLAAKPNPFRLPDADTISSLIRSARQCLDHRALDVLGNPRDADTFGVFMQPVFRKVMLLAQRSKRLCALLLVRARQSAGRCPLGVVAHPSESLVGFRKQRVIQTPSGFQVRTQMAFLAPIDLEG